MKYAAVWIKNKNGHDRKVGRIPDNLNLNRRQRRMLAKLMRDYWYFYHREVSDDDVKKLTEELLIDEFADALGVERDIPF